MQDYSRFYDLATTGPETDALIKLYFERLKSRTKMLIEESELLKKQPPFKFDRAAQSPAVLNFSPSIKEFIAGNSYVVL